MTYMSVEARGVVSTISHLYTGELGVESSCLCEYVYAAGPLRCQAVLAVVSQVERAGKRTLNHANGVHLEDSVLSCQGNLTPFSFAAGQLIGSMCSIGLPTS